MREKGWWLGRRYPDDHVARICGTVSEKAYGRVRSLLWRIRRRTTEIRVGGLGQRLWLFGRIWIELDNGRAK